MVPGDRQFRLEMIDKQYKVKYMNRRVCVVCRERNTFPSKLRGPRLCRLSKRVEAVQLRLELAVDLLPANAVEFSGCLSCPLGTTTHLFIFSVGVRQLLSIVHRSFDRCMRLIVSNLHREENYELPSCRHDGRRTR